MFKKARYPLPKFPPNIRSTFKSLCIELTGDTLNDFRNEAESFFVEKEKIADSCAKPLVKAARTLLEKYDQLTPKDRVLASGALRYFLAENDLLPEGEFASGLVDDAKIMNHVLEKLGLEDLYIEY